MMGRGGWERQARVVAKLPAHRGRTARRCRAWARVNPSPNPDPEPKPEPNPNPNPNQGKRQARPILSLHAPLS
eukprot:scaffold34788_cov51-Phaeocystis_antarctica.AAC.1